MADIQYFSSSGERAGLALIGLSGLLSALSTLSLLAYITWNAYLTKDRSSTVPLPHRDSLRSFVQSSLGCYLLSLLLCDFLQGIAFTMNFIWSAKGIIRVGAACTLQGAVSEVGELGVTIWSFAISLHTFSLLFLGHKPNRLIAPTVLFLGWALSILLSILGPTVIQTREKGPFYGPTGAWCWVSALYKIERLIFLYIWIFTALGTSVITYTLIYLRFIITINDNGEFQFQWSLGGANSTNSSDPTAMKIMAVSKDLKQVARRLMWYPIIYGFVVIPISVCRMGLLAGWTPPFGLYLFAGICFAGSGVMNSILFIVTRHSFLKRVAQTPITVREDAAGNDVEFAPIQSPTNSISKSLVFMESPFATLGTDEKSYASSVGSDSDDVSDQKGGIYASVIK